MCSMGLYTDERPTTHCKSGVSLNKLGSRYDRWPRALACKSDEGTCFVFSAMQDLSVETALVS